MDNYKDVLNDNGFRWFLSAGLFFIFAGVGFSSMILPALAVFFYRLGQLPEYVEPDDLVSMVETKA